MYKFHVSTPKTDAGIRKIPMSGTVYKAFAAQKRQNFLQRIPRNVEIEGRTDFIFMSKNGRPLMPSAVNNAFYESSAVYHGTRQYWRDDGSLQPYHRTGKD